ncbi:iron ABC transporter permease, partial [Cronobacter dublinensis subsp. dublinensis]|nr:iron ABC transporter permease [Cronobacter dublinensis subsp. dublinensis]
MNDRTRRFALTVIIALGLLLTLMLWSLCQGAVPLDWR